MKCSDVTVMSTWKLYTPLNCIKQPAEVDIEGYICITEVIFSIMIITLFHCCQNKNLQRKQKNLSGLFHH